MTKDLRCIHRAGCPKPGVCGKVGHCTSMTETDLRLHADMSREEVDSVMDRTAEARTSNLVSRLREFQADTTGHMLHRAAFQQAADEIERACRIMRRAISWLQIKEAAVATHKGPAIIEEMQRYVAGLPDETSELSAANGVIYDRLGWVCSICHGWNHAGDKLCTHTHMMPPEEPSSELSRYRCMFCNRPFATIVVLNSHEETCEANRAAVKAEDPPACNCPEVCKVCGGRANACALLGHRSEADRSVKWHKCPSEKAKTPLRDSDAAFNLGVLPTEQPEKASDTPQHDFRGPTATCRCGWFGHPNALVELKCPKCSAEFK